MAKAVGIEFGTKLGAVAVVKDGEPQIITNAEGDRLTPLVVAIDKHGERLVGSRAQRQAITNLDNTIFSIERMVGHKFKDHQLQLDVQRFPYKIVEAPDGDAWVVMGDKEYSPSEISGMILQKLKTDAEAYLGENVTDAVITAPIWFNDNQREVVKDAGKIAGLNVLGIISRPDAAVLTLGLNQEDGIFT